MSFSPFINLKSQSVEDVTIVYYNVLNFPNASNTNPDGEDAARHVYFREIIESVDADIIVLQEFRALFGAQDLVTELNSNGILSKTYNHSLEYYNYGSLGNMIIYNDDIIDLIDHIEVPRINSQQSQNGSPEISPRANSRFILDVYSSVCTNEKVRLEVYSAHLKGSNDNATNTNISDRDRRNLGAKDFMDYIDTIPLSRNIIFGGDCNLYADNANGGSNSEPAYVTLTNSSYNHQFTDVLGGWVRNSFSFVDKFTQSTRIAQNQYGNSGVSGGLDDRFDFIFINESIDLAQNQISYLAGSYENIGNPGVLNGQVTDGNHPLKNQIQKMSDHLPVKMTIQIDFPSCSTVCSGVLLNEIHYDNQSVDIDQFVEIAVPNNFSVNLANYDLHLYDGISGDQYFAENLDNAVFESSDSNYDYYTWEPDSIQNGSPNGFALSEQGTHCSFLSYEGSFVANNGPSSGLTSIDLVASEDGNDLSGASLQLIGGVWQGPIPNTKGTVNILSCYISNLSIQNAVCTGQDFEYEVHFNTTSSSGNFEVIDANNNVLASANSSPIVLSMVGNSSTQSFDIRVRDAIDGTCIGNHVAVYPIDCSPQTCTGVYINELAYENEGSDFNEFVEIAVDNSVSVNLANFEVNLYNGSSGMVYDNQVLANFAIGNDDGNFTYYTWYPISIQNGNPDGLSLNTTGLLCEFLSYEGDFTATDGPAMGVVSMDINVDEPANDPDGYSLQLISGVWLGAISETPGDTNANTNCQSNVNLTGVETGIADFESSDNITSTQTIATTAQVDYDAANSVILQHPFNVELGGILYIFIDGCNNGTGGVNLLEQDAQKD